VDSLIMLVVALIGLLANLYAVIILKKDVHKSINVRAAYVHLLGDTISSVLVVIGGLLIQFRQWYWIDPVITVLISAYIIREAFVILREAVNILMQSAPAGMDLENIRRSVEKVPDVRNIHHLHAWMLNDRQIHLEAHVELNRDLKLSEIKTIQTGIENILSREFRVKHTTLQFEFDPEHAPLLIESHH
jgi:cobalt-zinc-cadmium efflux system protein